MLFKAHLLLLKQYGVVRWDSAENPDQALQDIRV